MKRNYHDRDLKAQSPLLRAVVIYMLLQKWVAFISLHFYTRNIYIYIH